MLTPLEKKLTGNINKNEFILYLNQNREQFENAIKIALGDDVILGWRAAWIIKLSMKRNDERIKPHLKNLIDAIKNKKEGHQRELLNIIEKIKIDEDIEGYLFDICMTLWEDTRKIPSVRIVAFRMIYKIVKKYPELYNEIEFITQDHYAESLSPGIKKSFFRMKKELQSLKN